METTPLSIEQIEDRILDLEATILRAVNTDNRYSTSGRDRKDQDALRDLKAKLDDLIAEAA